MSLDARLEHLERKLDPGATDVPFIVVDRGEAPSDPQAREAWIQSKVPPGTANVMVIRVIREHLHAGEGK